MRKIMCILLFAALLLELAGCGKQQTQETASASPPTQSTSHTTTGTAPSSDSTMPTEPTEPEILRYYVDAAADYVSAGYLETLLTSGEVPAVSYNNAYKGQPGRDYSAPALYTFRDYLVGATDMQWSPLTWQTTQDAYILEYTTTGLYTFTLNSDLSGWTILCEMAAAPPEDVTQDYIGQFGITQGQTARAWRIRLNPEACWSNGDRITAQTYVYSYQQLLDPRLENSRASEICWGDLSIAGAANYCAGTDTWENVGILATDTYELVLITAESVSQPEFFLPYYLQSTYLVYQPLWESCKQYYDAAGNLLVQNPETAVRITSTYGTSAKTSLSYGPYVLVSYQAGEKILLERNFTWYGYADGKHLGQYQTDIVDCRIFESYAEAMQAYKAGRLDRLYLQGKDQAQWQDSGLLRYQPETYTTKLTFNTDPVALAQRGNLVLANAAFRQAISFSLDRSCFANGMPALGLVNELYMAGAGTSLLYRDTALAQHSLAQIYGCETGHDPITAQTLMQRAFVQCMANGSYDGSSTLTLQLSVYQEDETYTQLRDYLQQALEEACRSTGFEGKILVELAVDENCYIAMAQGKTDMVLSTWGGNPCDPYGLLYHAHCGKNRLEYGFDPASVTVRIGIAGEEYVTSMLSWAQWCAGIGEAPVSEDGAALLAFDQYSPESKADIFAQLEYAYLSQYVALPLYSRGGVWLLSEKGDFAVKNARSLIGFGGLRYYHFAYTDNGWNNRK